MPIKSCVFRRGAGGVIVAARRYPKQTSVSELTQENTYL
jgi:hypothetical protein